MMKKSKIKFVFVCCLISLLSSCKLSNDASKVEVSFETYGGTMYYDMRVLPGDTITLPTPEREGYEFAGWYSNEEFSTVLDGTYLVSTTDQTLYAKWLPYSGTVKFESNGGTKYEDLDFYAQRVSVPTPKKDGFIFEGWYDNQYFTGEAISESFLPKDDITLYAKWGAIVGSVVFVSNGGTEYEKVDTKGQKVELPIPEKEGYIFAGWYDNPAFDGKVYEGSFLPTKTITLYARWALSHHLISFEENGGVELDNILLYDDDNLTLPTPSRFGYTFAGWYESDELTGEPVTEYFYRPTSDVTLYAKWTKCSYLYLFYGDSKMDWVRYEYPVGDVVSLDELYALFTPEDVTLVDYLGYSHVVEFMYWSYQGFDETEHFKVETSIVMEQEVVTLVAQYDTSAVPPTEYLSYNMETDVYTTTGKVAHVFLEDQQTMPYVYSLDLSFRKGIGGGVGPAFRMNVPRVNYHYEGGCDYLSPNIIPGSGEMQMSSVLNGSWSRLVSNVPLASMPQAWQDKFNSAQTNEKISLTMSIVDYGTSFEVYIDNDLALTYASASKLANYPYDDLGVRSSSTPVDLFNARVSTGYEVSYVTGVDGLNINSTKWYCGDIELPYVNRENYAIEGWYYDKEFTKPVDDENFYIESDISLYAKWSDDYHEISFDTNGGSDVDSVKWVQGKLYLPNNPTKMNYKFTGWYYDENCTTPVDPYSFNATADTTLYAGWNLYSSHIVDNKDGTYTYNTKTEAVLGTVETAIPTQGNYNELSQTLSMPRDSASAGIAFRMNMNGDYTYESTGCYYLSVQFCGASGLRISQVKNGAWSRLLPNNKDYALTSLPQSYQNKYNSIASDAIMTVKLTIRDYGTYFEVYIDDELAYTYGQNGETVDLLQYTGNGYGIRCSVGSTVIFSNITAKAVSVN